MTNKNTGRARPKAPSRQINPAQFDAYRLLILTEQIPQESVSKLLEENPEFKAWYLKRKDK